MPADRRLVDRFSRTLAPAVLTDEMLRQERAVRSALNEDGTWRADAIVDTLPRQRIDFRLVGPVATGPMRGGIFEIPEGGVIRKISAYARIGPTGEPFTGHLVVNDETVDSGSIQPGTTSVSSGATIPVPPGGVVTLRVTSAGAAEDVTVSVFYQPGVPS